jgi:hypothetical protein
VRRDKNKLDFELQAQNQCGETVGWSGLQVTYEVKFKK